MYMYINSTPPQNFSSPAHFRYTFPRRTGNPLDNLKKRIICTYLCNWALQLMIKCKYTRRYLKIAGKIPTMLLNQHKCKVNFVTMKYSARGMLYKMYYAGNSEYAIANGSNGYNCIDYDSWCGGEHIFYNLDHHLEKETQMIPQEYMYTPLSNISLVCSVRQMQWQYLNCKANLNINV